MDETRKRSFIIKELKQYALSLSRFYENDVKIELNVCQGKGEVRINLTEYGVQNSIDQSACRG